jgi:Zn-dependent protease with chaperone function
VTTESLTHTSPALAPGAGDRLKQPAGEAATRVARAQATLGVLGLASALFVVTRLAENWRVSPGAASHHISILGYKLSYPAANFAAILVLGLALIGLAVTALAVLGAARELAASRRFRRWLEARERELLDEALVIDDERPRAFCAGLLKPRVYVSTGAVALLDKAALRAVMAHEQHHARRRDPLRLAAGRVLARALFFMPGLAALVRRQQALAELSADENALQAEPGNRAALARAMLSFSDASGPSDQLGVAAARVDFLLGEPASWRFPTLLCTAALLVAILLVATAILAGQVATGSATLAPPFLSSRPCVVVLALIPAAIGVFALVRRSRWS